MSFKDECTAAVKDILKTPFVTRTGYQVPTTDTVALKNGGVYIEAAYLYADMADSTGMATHFTQQQAARIIRAYLNAVCRAIRDR